MADHRQTAITGLVMAGGMSRRMGQDKTQILIAGVSLTRLAVDKLSNLCERVVISGRKDDHQDFTEIVIEDLVQGLGPMGGLYSVMMACPSDRYLVLAPDIPLVSVHLLDLLLKQECDGIVVPRGPDGSVEPLVAVYPRTALPMIREMLESGNRALHKLIERYPSCYLDYTAHQIPENTFLNLNSPADLKSFLEVYGEK